MALCGEFTWRGVTVPSAYVRIDSIRGGKYMPQIVPERPTESYWSATAGVYADNTQSVPLLSVDVKAPFTVEESPYPGLYAALKQIPSLSGMVDC